MRITSIILSLMIVVSLTGTGVSSAEISPKQRFVTYAFSECNQVLITWEKVTNAESYKLFRNGINLTELNKYQNVYLDTDLDDNTYTYSINAISKTDSVTSTSIPITATTHCYETFECNTDMKFVLGNNYYFVNETKKGPMPIPPLISKDRTFLVIRYVTDELGAEIKWDGVQRKVSIITFRGKSIELIIGNNTAVVDGEEILIDPSDPSVVPIIESGRTLLPMRFVADQMGAEDVIWNDQEKSITLRFHNESICIKQKLLLTVNAVDCDNKKQISAMDTCNNLYRISLGDSESICDKLSEGSRILVDGDITKVQREGNSFVIHVSNNLITIPEGGVEITGRVEAVGLENMRGFIKINNCKSTQKFTFTPGLHGLETISKDSWINVISSDDNFISDWSFITNDVHCGLDSQNIFISEKNFGPDGLWFIESQTGKETSNNILIPGRNVSFDGLNTDSFCYLASYSTNWLGRNICTSVSEIDCGCNISVTPVEPSVVTIFANTKYEFTFPIKNNGDKTKKLLLKIDEATVYGTIKFSPTVLNVPPGEEVLATILVFASNPSEEEMSITYSVVCDAEKITNTLAVSVIEGTAKYKIKIPDGLVLNNNTRYVRIPFSLTNESTASVRAQATFTSSQSITNHTVTPAVINIAPNETVNFVAIGEMKFARVVGTTINLFLSVRMAGKNEITTIPMRVDHSGRPTVDVSYEIDETGSTTISGNVDWGTFTKSIMTIAWGDGATEEFENFPITHQYLEPGVYSVTICARTMDAEIYSSALGFGYCLVEYKQKSADVVKDIEFKPIDASGLKYKLSGTLQRDSKIKRIQVNWGDGQIAKVDVKNYKFERTYSYQTHVRHRSDMDYLVYVTFTKTNESNNESYISCVKRFNITIPGTGH